MGHKTHWYDDDAKKVNFFKEPQPLGTFKNLPPEELIHLVKQDPELFRKMYEGSFDEGGFENKVDAMRYETNTHLARFDNRSNKKELTEFYSKYKYQFPPDTWKKLQEGYVQIETSKNLYEDRTDVVLRGKNGSVLDKFFIVDDFDPRDRDWPDRYPKTEPEEKPMSNKFLPFVVESSTPLHIFKTLLSRSKGMNKVLIASVFNLTLQVDIKKLREFVKALPEMPLEKTYEELLVKYAQYRVPEDNLRLFTDVSLFLPGDIKLWDAKLDEFEIKDVMLFLCVLCHWNGSMEEYTEVSFDKLLDRSEVFNDLSKWIVLSDSGKKIHVRNDRELEAFIMYTAKLLPEIPGSEPPPTYSISMGQQ